MGNQLTLAVGFSALAILVVGIASRSLVIRRLAVGLALVATGAAFHVAVAFFELGDRWQEGADVALLLVVVLLAARAALLLVFDGLLARRGGVVVPRLARDIAAALLYLVVAAAALRGTLGLELTTLLATPAVLLAILGLALQETIGTLFAGLALSWERRLEAGTWIEVENVTGEIEEIGWRSTVLHTTLGERVLVPNSHLARARVKVLGRGVEPVAIPVRFSAGYGTPPHEVKTLVAAALLDVPLGVPERPAQVLVADLADSGVIYECRLWTREPGRAADVRDVVLERVRMALARAGVSIPYPHRTLHIAPRHGRPELRGDSRAALAASPVFGGLPDHVLEELALASRWQEFAAGEAVVREGDASHALYVVASGDLAAVRAGQVVGHLGAGEVFGEMALLSGERRAATVRATTGAVVVEIDASALRRVLGHHRELADVLATRMAERRETLEAAGEASGAPATPRSLASFLRERLLRLLDGERPAAP